MTMSCPLKTLATGILGSLTGLTGDPNSIATATLTSDPNSIATVAVTAAPVSEVNQIHSDPKDSKTKDLKLVSESGEFMTDTVDTVPCTAPSATILTVTSPSDGSPHPKVPVSPKSEEPSCPEAAAQSLFLAPSNVKKESEFERKCFASVEKSVASVTKSESQSVASVTVTKSDGSPLTASPETHKRLPRYRDGEARVGVMAMPMLPPSKVDVRSMGPPSGPIKRSRSISVRRSEVKSTEFATAPKTEDVVMGDVSASNADSLSAQPQTTQGTSTQGAPAEASTPLTRTESATENTSGPSKKKMRCESGSKFAQPLPSPWDVECESSPWGRRIQELLQMNPHLRVNAETTQRVLREKISLPQFREYPVPGDYREFRFMLQKGFFGPEFQNFHLNEPPRHGDGSSENTHKTSSGRINSPGSEFMPWTNTH